MTLINDDFLLESEVAKQLFHTYAKDEEIFDYHNHLSPKEISEHRLFTNLYQLWLEVDHYKWRVMRANGVDEKYITGDSLEYEKFYEFARIFPNLIGSPVYHWCLLELKRYFGIEEILNQDNALVIWNKTVEMMKDNSYTTVTLLEKMKVRYCCTTDDPADDLRYHQAIKNDPTINIEVLPSFRPDKYLDVNSETWILDCEKLCAIYQTNNIKEALSKALLYFKENGCILADHGFSIFDYQNKQVKELIDHLAKEYYKLGISMQLHLGPIRNNSYKLLKSYGKDAGGDSIGFISNPKNISDFLYYLESENSLPKTILYNLNPADNEMLATMAINYAPKVQYGAAWWFNDTLRGIENQIDNLMETGALSYAVGMLTDSRSFTSFVRHEYYRRILCNKIGTLVEKGLYPNDLNTLGTIVRNVCFKNAKEFFIQTKGEK